MVFLSFFPVGLVTGGVLDDFEWGPEVVLKLKRWSSRWILAGPSRSSHEKLLLKDVFSCKKLISLCFSLLQKCF